MTRTHLMMPSSLLSLLLLSVLLLSATAPATAQRQGDLELSLSGTAGSVSHTITNSAGTARTTSTATATYATLALRTGIFFTRQFEIEPEVLWTAAEGAPPVYSAAANAIYNVQIRGARVIPFVLLGYGIGNGIPAYGHVSPSDRLSSDWNVSHINAGAGIRFLFDRQASLRLEYRFGYYTHESSATVGTIPFTSDVIHRDHALLIGLSLFLP